MAALEQVRDIFDKGDIGLVLIGIPGIEKRLARYPQLYSRVGFVHAFRPLSAGEVRQILQQKWLPSGVVLPANGWADEETLAAIIRITGRQLPVAPPAHHPNGTPRGDQRVAHSHVSSSGSRPRESGDWDGLTILLRHILRKNPRH